MFPVSLVNLEGKKLSEFNCQAAALQNFLFWLEALQGMDNKLSGLQFVESGQC